MKTINLILVVAAIGIANPGFAGSDYDYTSAHQNSLGSQTAAAPIPTRLPATITVPAPAEAVAEAPNNHAEESKLASVGKPGTKPQQNRNVQGNNTIGANDGKGTVKTDIGKLAYGASGSYIPNGDGTFQLSMDETKNSFTVTDVTNTPEAQRDLQRAKDTRESDPTKLSQSVGGAAGKLVVIEINQPLSAIVPREKWNYYKPTDRNTQLALLDQMKSGTSEDPNMQRVVGMILENGKFPPLAGGGGGEQKGMDAGGGDPI